VCRCVLSCALLLGLTATVWADPKPLSKEEQAKVDKAIEKAVAYLKKAQTEAGDWPSRWPKSYPVGHCALPAYALLEAGVPARDPAIKRAAKYLRSKIVDNNVTYELSLGILFFDRLGDPKDKKLIQSCALRLIAGQHRSGGWSYRCPKLKEDDEEIFVKLLTQLSKLYEAGKKPTVKTLRNLTVPAALQPLTVFQDRRSLVWRELFQIEGMRHAGFTLEKPEIPGNPLIVIPTDNSNTQFAMLALWAAQRQGTPMHPTFDLLVERFERSQGVDGCWPYSVADKMTPSMICVGLMGLAIGRGLKLTSSGKPRPGGEDPHVLKGLAALYKKVGFPTGQMEPPVLLQDLYFLWSVERVGMLYDLPMLGNKEWYRWGAESLVVNQRQEGDWGPAPILGSRGGSTDNGPSLNTAFALLFLKHSHPMNDLTPKLPFKAKELNQGIARVLRDTRILEGITPSRSQSTEPDH
jgi:hypothetical protein